MKKLECTEQFVQSFEVVLAKRNLGFFDIDSVAHRRGELLNVDGIGAMNSFFLFSQLRNRPVWGR